MNSLPISPSVRWTLSLGGAFFRLWDRQRGLVVEIPACVVVDKETQAVKLYGQEALALVGKVPDHLEIVYAWSEDKILDRELLRTLLQAVLQEGLEKWSERWQRAVQTQILIPESILPLHQRWLLRTAREAGWWLLPTQPAHRPLLRGLTSKSRSLPTWHTTSFCDLGFSMTRFVVYLGEELILAKSTSDWTLKKFTEVLSEYVREKHQIFIAPQHFADQNWAQTRLAFHQTRQRPIEWSLDPTEWQKVAAEFWRGFGQWIENEVSLLPPEYQSEVRQRPLWLLGGGAGLWQEFVKQEFPLTVQLFADASYAQLRATKREK